ncbi:MAG: TetR family transcriptional regulator [Acidobacteria bacterium]|uniref:TetR family transcriptional regulator n=1 Tax=Candidatus Polarisedimenticola svalbardensis TaxID=2886004 RepID=A0A8J6XX49_9BACT|nr:TetR family transcriptional regulator [Candidatus Polarisedimenticola svalbardensis]
MVQLLNSRSNAENRIQRRAEGRRQEILRAAARVFRRRGFDAAGMREIAEEADLSPGNLYHYFKGKQEILYYCQDRALDTMLATLEQAATGETVSLRLTQVLTAHVRCILDDMEGAAAHLVVDAFPLELRRPIVAKRDRYETGVRKLVEEGEQSGEFSVQEPVIITRAILGALNWTAQWFDPDGRKNPGEVAEIIAAYLVRGLRGETRT